MVLDLLLPGVEPATLALALFGWCLPQVTPSREAAVATSTGSSGGLLMWMMQHSLNCTEMTVEPWTATTASSSVGAGRTPRALSTPAAGGRGSGSDDGDVAARKVSYSMPLKPRQRLLLPLGPAAVPTREEQVLQALPGGGLEVRSRCTSTGVPFADCFANVLRWQLLPVNDGGGSSGSSTGQGAEQQQAALALRPAGTSGGGSPLSTRLMLTASCHFHRPVLGPLRGQIERESLQAGWADWCPGGWAAGQAAGVWHGWCQRCHTLALLSAAHACVSLLLATLVPCPSLQRSDFSTMPRELAAGREGCVLAAAQAAGRAWRRRMADR